MSQTSKAGLQRITYGWGREAADEVGGQIQVTAGTTEFDVARQAGPGPVKSGRAPHGGPRPGTRSTQNRRVSLFNLLSSWFNGLIPTQRQCGFIPYYGNTFYA